MSGAVNTGIGSTAVRYRILYDTLSRLICNMNKCDDLRELNTCLANNLKYLFDYVAIKFSISVPAAPYSVFVPRNQHFSSLFTADFCTQVQHYECVAADSQMVQHHNEPGKIRELVAGAASEKLDAVWVFPFRIRDGYLVVSIMCGQGLDFYRADIPILKILCEAYLARLVGLSILDELTRGRKTLEDAYIRLDNKTHEIERLNNIQEHVIEERTAELQQKNKKLGDLVKFNAHQIREPLTRILGLLYVMDLTDNWEKGELSEALKRSGQDLDTVVKNVITYIEHE